MPGDAPSTTPAAPGTGPGAGELAAGELALLLELERHLWTASDPGDLASRLAGASERVAPWVAFAFLGSGDPGRPLPVLGGGPLDSAARERFEEAVRTVAREAGLPWTGLAWSREAAGSGESPGSPGEPLVIPWARRGGPRGLLALLPAAPGPVPAPARRLLAGLVRQAEAWLDRRRREEAARREELSALLEALPGGALVLDGEGSVMAASERARRIISDLHGAPVPAAACLMAAGGLGLAGIPPGHDVELSGRLNQRRYALRWSLLPGPGGRRLVLLADVTLDRAAREQALQAEKLSVLGEMLSGVAHELNNPLASVIGFSELLLRRSDDPEMQRRLRLVGEEAQRARRIVGNLLDVARPRPSERTAVSLDEVVQGILALFAYAFRVDEVTAEWRPGPDLPPVLADRARLQQVLVNLVGNAHQALRTASGPRRILLAADAVGGRVRLEISDTGPGIPESHLDRIFEPFFTTKAPGLGTGLGLAICARIVAEHGGRIHAQSRPGEGACFILDLPIGELRVEEPAAVAAAPEPPSGCRVLVVEDEAPFRDLLVEALQAEGYLAEGAADGAEALERLGSRPWDAVVTDVRMPRMDGMALHAEVARRRPELAGRFVFMTGDVMDPGIRQFFERRQAPHLPKPFGLDELLSLLGRTLSGDGPGPVLDSPGDS